MTKLIITRGLPASGKTTRAKQWVRQQPGQRVRVNRDDLRAMSAIPHAPDSEMRIIKQRDMLITDALNGGYDVVNDDTNLPSRTVRDLATLAMCAGADFEVWDMTYVDPQTCGARNVLRQSKGEPGVPDDVIWGMWSKYLEGKAHPLPVPEVKEKDSSALIPYTANIDMPTAFIFDIDGTVAHNTSGRSPFDGTRVGEDTPDYRVIAMAEMLHSKGHRIIFMSGRKSDCRQETLSWLYEHVSVGRIGLIMRDADDNRHDYLVKYELFNEHVRDDYNVLGVFDDRKQVVDMWRAIGLKCYQVAEGNF